MPSATTERPPPRLRTTSTPRRPASRNPARQARVLAFTVGILATTFGLDFAVADRAPVERSPVAEREVGPPTATTVGKVATVSASEPVLAAAGNVATAPLGEAGIGNARLSYTGLGPATTTTTTHPPEPLVPSAAVSLDDATAHIDPGGADPYLRAVEAYEAAVPPEWRARTSVYIRVIGGGTSWSHSSGSIVIGSAQMDTWRHALYVVAHEWGHQVAYAFGSGAYLGAPPAGFPGGALLSEPEQFAECVAQALLGYRWPNPYPHCPEAALDWTRAWLRSGPP